MTSPRISIALLHYSAPPVVGGVESVLAHHARLMDAAGHDVRIVAGRGEQACLPVPFVSLPFDDRCAAEYGTIRADLSARGEPIGPLDLLIAATARAHDLTLVSHNVGEFSRVAGLRFEDWE